MDGASKPVGTWHSGQMSCLVVLGNMSSLDCHRVGILSFGHFRDITKSRSCTQGIEKEVFKIEIVQVAVPASLEDLANRLTRRHPEIVRIRGGSHCSGSTNSPKTHVDALRPESSDEIMETTRLFRLHTEKSNLTCAGPPWKA